MYDKMRGIVLNTVRYNDRTSIVHVYSDTHGLMAFAVAQGKTQAARMRNAMLMPLSLIEMEARITPGRELATMHDMRRTLSLMSVYCDPVKNAVAMFMSEVLTHAIQERERNEALYTFIYNSVTILEHLERGVANFHICFLYRLGILMGIEPDVSSYREGYWFNLNEGIFVPSAVNGRGRYLRPHEASVIVTLSRMRYDNLHLFRFNRDQRNLMLDVILDYYKLHHSTLGSLRSPEVLKQLFV